MFAPKEGGPAWIMNSPNRNAIGLSFEVARGVTYLLSKPRGTTGMRNGYGGRRLSKRYGILNVPTLVTSVSRGAAMTFNRLRLDCAGRTFDNMSTEDGYAFHINFLKQESFSVFRRARAAERYFLAEGDSTM